MQNVFHCGQIWFATVNGHAQIGEIFAPIFPGGSLHCDWVIPPCGLKHAQNSFMPTDDEITSPFGLLLAFLDQFLRRKIFQMASTRFDHDWEVTQDSFHHRLHFAVYGVTGLDNASTFKKKMITFKISNGEIILPL